MVLGTGCTLNIGAQDTMQEAVDTDGDGIPDAVTIDNNLHDTATVTLDAYDLAADTETEVYPEWTVFNIVDKKLINDAVANSTTISFVGDNLKTYGTGTTYYCDPVEYPVNLEAGEIVEMDCYTGAAESSMELKLYDSDKDALTASSNSTNEADYSAALGAGEDSVIYMKLANRDSDSVYWLGALCTFYGNDIDDYVLDEGDFTEIPLPKEVKDATWAIKNDSGSDLTGDWDHCYAMLDNTGEIVPLALEEWDDTGYLRTVVTGGSTEPAAHTGDNYGVLALDYSYVVGAEGRIHGGLDDDTTSEDVGNMGCIDEGTELIDAFALDIVASVEAS